MASIYVGTSGFSYKEWKPIFYPEGLSDKQFLSYYATRFRAVEIDSTFYRIPTPSTVEGWRSATPDSFRFAIKAPQKITHRERLAVPSEANAYFLRVLGPLGSRLGIVLYQLPPFARVDHDKLARFVDSLPRPGEPGAAPVAFEFRHPSWFVPATYALLRERGAALCIHDQEELEPPLELTAPRTYVRLRRSSYDAAARALWRERMRTWADSGVDVFAFIKHKDNPEAPLIALQFAEGL